MQKKMAFVPILVFFLMNHYTRARELHSRRDKLKAIKADTKTLELQNEFFNRVKTAP